MYFNGTRTCALILSCFLSLSVMAKDAKMPAATNMLHKPLCFIENKGQIHDEHNNQRSDIRYRLSAPGMSMLLGNGQLYYNFKKISAAAPGADAQVSTRNIIVTLLGANPNATVVAAEPQEYYENYFMDATSNTAVSAHSFNKVTYKDVYKNIDWVVYIKGSTVEYDFVVRPGGNVQDIRIKYDGTTGLKLNHDGSLAATTSLGSISEHKPFAFEQGTGKEVASNFVLNDNVLSFKTGSYNGTLTIDPYLGWSTYFGGLNEDVVTGVKQSSGGETFVSGYTSSNAGIFFGPALDNSLSGTYDAFAAKYNTAGGLMWSTYYGGTGDDRGSCIALDNTGANPNVYLAGITSTPTFPLNVINTGGAFDATYGGSNDGFLLKLTNNGNTRIWATYYGGPSDDHVNGVVCDAANNVYITGQTSSASGVASGGAYQPTRSGSNDAFIAKFNAGGTNFWSTYYGGSAQEEAFGIAVDPSLNVIITGQTSSVIVMATTGAHQTALSGTNDAFIAKFTTTGLRTWSTYYGGTGLEQGSAVACNALGEIVIAGNTTSATGMATSKAYQTSYAGTQDAFISYFTAGGGLVWSTYSGGNSLDYAQSVCFDANNNIVMAGGTFSNTGIASPIGTLNPAAYQSGIAGDYDAYVQKLSPLGQRLWGTYFGGTLYDFANGVACDLSTNRIVLAGYSTSNGNYGAGGISTAGAQQVANNGGLYDGFVTKFATDTLVTVSQPYEDTILCIGGTFNVNYNVSNNFQPGNVFTVQLSDASGSFAFPVNIGSGSTSPISVTIPMGTLPGLGYRIRIVASNPVYISPDNFYNIELLNTLPPTTATSNSPICVGNTLLLGNNSYYAVTSYNWSGPTGFTSTLQNPTRTSVTLAEAGTYSVTTTHNSCPAITSAVNVVINNVAPPTPTDSVTNPACVGSPIYLFADPDTTATGITYSWSGPAGFSSTMQNPVIPVGSLANSGVYTLTDTLAGCASNSTTVTIVVNPVTPVSISITASPGDTVCAGTAVTFTATTVNGGISPQFQWMSGIASPIIGAISNTFTSSTLLDGSAMFCTMRADIQCPSPIIASSNTIIMNVISNPPIVHIYASAGPYVTPGSPVTFTSAVYNGGTGAQYQWRKNGVNIPGATSSSYVFPSVTKRDTITLRVTSTMMCASPNVATSNMIVIQTNVGVNELTASLDNIELYPNPNSGTFTVKGNLEGISGNKVSLDIVNALGQLVHTETATLNSNELDQTVQLQNIPTGIYLLRVSSDNQSKTFRFTVTR